MKRILILILSIFILISNIQSRTLVNCNIYLDQNITENEEQIFIENCYINGRGHTLKINNLVLVGERSTLILNNITLDCSDGKIEVEAEAQIVPLGIDTIIISGPCS